MAMCRWAPSGERVPERLRISSSPWIAVASSRSRQAQLGHRQAADGADHTAGLLLLLAHPGLQRPAQVIARLQPQRHHLHGVGPSTSPWTITKAST